MAVPRHALRFAAALLASASGCRERQVATAPAVGSGSGPADVAAVAVPLSPATLREARSDPSLCSLDYVDKLAAQGERTVERDRPVRLRGWFGTPAHAAAGDFRLVLSGDASAWAVPAHTGDARPDVVEYFQSRAMATAGFDVRADLSAVAPGAYAVVLLSGDEGAMTACDTAKRLRLP